MTAETDTATNRRERDERIAAAFTDRLPDAELKEVIARECHPLVLYLARRYAGRGEALEDLVQVAEIGLLHATDRFDPERGVQFSTFAAATIVGELKRHLRDKAWSVRVPRRLQEIALVVNKALPELAQTLGEIDERFELATGWADVAPAIRELPARERRILYLRFFENRTQSEIAAEIGISQMHVSRILSQTLATLRDAVT